MVGVVIGGMLVNFIGIGGVCILFGVVNGVNDDDVVMIV